MAGTVVAVFDSNRQAEEAAQALLDDGVQLADISLVFRGAGGATGAPDVEGDAPTQKHDEFLSDTVRQVEEHDVERPINTVDEALPRAVVGFVIGGMLMPLLTATLIFLPSVQAITAAASLPVQFGSSLLGAVVGATVGVLTSGGIPAEAAQAYHQQVERGRTLVTVLASSANAPHFQDILRRHGGRRLGFFTRFLDSVQSIES
jgi:hypothetical protein